MVHLVEALVLVELQQVEVEVDQEPSMVLVLMVLMVLGLDAMWQLVGFYLCWLGNPGRGRALGSSEVKFFGQVLPTAKLVTLKIDMKRILNLDLTVGIGEGSMLVDGREIYSAKGLKVGLFQDTSSF